MKETAIKTGQDFGFLNPRTEIFSRRMSKEMTIMPSMTNVGKKRSFNTTITAITSSTIVIIFQVSFEFMAILLRLRGNKNVAFQPSPLDLESKLIGQV